jgi:hypothetical protein
MIFLLLYLARYSGEGSVEIRVKSNLMYVFSKLMNSEDRIWDISSGEGS